MTVTDNHTVAPADVHKKLGRHMLVDGFDFVLDLEKSHGVYLHDAVRGRELLDCFTSFSTSPLGYNHPGMMTPEFKDKIVNAAINKPANSDLYTTEMAEFVETFARTLPEDLRGHLFFIAGGALAVENAMKVAFDWKARKNRAAGRNVPGSKILHFREAFHGRSGYTMSVTNTDPNKTADFPKFEDWPRVSNPKLRFPITDEVTRNVAAAEAQTVREIEEAVGRFGHDIAGLLIEPIQGEGGDNHFRAEFFAELRRLADEHEFLLLFDEVQTGFGTTGKWWAFQNYGVTPDVIAFGKKTQVCGIAAGPRVDEVDSVFKVSSRINSTWGGNLVDMIRCQRIVEIVEEEKLLERARDTGAFFLDGLRSLEQTFPGKITNARGLGLFLAVDLPDNETRQKALASLVDYDMLGLASGQRSIRFRPPLILETQQAGEALDRLERTFKALL